MMRKRTRKVVVDEMILTPAQALVVRVMFSERQGIIAGTNVRLQQLDEAINGLADGYAATAGMGEGSFFFDQAGPDAPVVLKRTPLSPPQGEEGGGERG